MIQILASYIILRQDYAFRCFLLKFRYFKCFAHDHSRHQPLRRKEKRKKWFLCNLPPIKGFQQGTWWSFCKKQALLDSFLTHILCFTPENARCSIISFRGSHVEKLEKNGKILDPFPMQSFCIHVIQGKEPQDSVSPSWKGKVEPPDWSPGSHPALTFHILDVQ